MGAVMETFKFPVRESNQPSVPRTGKELPSPQDVPLPSIEILKRPAESHGDLLEILLANVIDPNAMHTGWIFLVELLGGDHDGLNDLTSRQGLR